MAVVCPAPALTETIKIFMGSLSVVSAIVSGVEPPGRVASCAFEAMVETRPKTTNEA